MIGTDADVMFVSRENRTRSFDFEHKIKKNSLCFSRPGPVKDSDSPPPLISHGNEQCTDKTAVRIHIINITHLSSEYKMSFLQTAEK